MHGVFTIWRTDTDDEDNAAPGWSIEHESYSGGTKLDITAVSQSQHKIAIKGVCELKRAGVFAVAVNTGYVWEGVGICIGCVFWICPL